MKGTTTQGIFWTICNILGLNKEILYLPDLSTGHINGDLEAKVYGYFKMLTKKEKERYKKKDG